MITKNKIKEILGWSLLIALFIGIVIYSIVKNGYEATLILCGISFLLTVALTLIKSSDNDKKKI